MRRALAVMVVCMLFPTSAGADSDWRSAPIVPHVDLLKQRLEKKFAAGEDRGLSPDVFAKLGDSITASPNFLSGFACGDEVLGSHGDLAATISYFDSPLPTSDTAVGCGTATPGAGPRPRRRRGRYRAGRSLWVRATTRAAGVRKRRCTVSIGSSDPPSPS